MEEEPPGVLRGDCGDHVSQLLTEDMVNLTPWLKDWGALLSNPPTCRRSCFREGAATQPTASQQTISRRAILVPEPFQQKPTCT